MSPPLKACGNSAWRNLSSSATLIFAIAIALRLPSPRAACYIKVTGLPKRIFVDISMTSQTARAARPNVPILLRETLGSIAVLTLNRPTARNSLSERLIAELHASLDEIRDDAQVRAVVIAANGP